MSALEYKLLTVHELKVFQSYSIFAETQLGTLHAGPDFNLCKISMNNKV